MKTMRYADTANRTQAVAEARALVEAGMSANKAAQQTGTKYGVAARTVQTWAQKDGHPLGDTAHAAAKNAREIAQQEYRARRALLRLKLLDAAEFAVAQFKQAEGKEAQAYAVACGIFIDKMRLEEGEVTSRTESWSADEWSKQLKMLEAEVARTGPSQAA